MDAIFEFLVILGGALAALAVAGMCGVCLVVWLAGGGAHEPTEAWRQADKT